MAISSAAVWEVRATGSDANGGLFVAGAGTDYSQQDSPALSLSDVATTGTTTVTSATGGFTAAMVGNGFNVAGTVYQITAVGSGTSVTVDRAAASGTGQAGRVGGACGSPGYVWGKVVTGNVVWLRSGMYGVTTTTANVSGGPIASPGSAVAVSLRGYGTVRGDGGGPPVMLAALNGVTLMSNPSGSGTLTVENVILDGGGYNGNGLFGTFNTVYAVGLIARNMPSGTGFHSYQAKANFESCLASSCLTGFDCSNAGNGGATACVTDACGTSFTGLHMTACISRNPTQYHTSWGNVPHAIHKCSFYGSATFNGGELMVGCIVSGANTVDAYGAWFFKANAVYGGTLSPNRAYGGYVQEGTVALSGNPFVSPTAAVATVGDAWAAFALNSTAGAGALCRGGLYPGAADLGAVQSKSGGSSGVTARERYYRSLAGVTE